MDKDFYDGIFNFSFDFHQFYTENKQLTDVHYDISDSAKYYSFDLIKQAIQKFMNKEITYRYFADWCNAYNWIITADHYYNPDIKNVIFREISWFLDGLSFTDEQVSLKEGKEWIKSFELLDDIYQSNDWEAFYAPTVNADFNDDQNILLYNDKKKLFTIIYMEHIKNGYKDEDIIFMSEDELIEKIKYYKKHYSFFEYSIVKYLDDEIRLALKGVKKIRM